MLLEAVLLSRAEWSQIELSWVKGNWAPLTDRWGIKNKLLYFTWIFFYKMTHSSEVTDLDEFLRFQHYVLQIPFFSSKLISDCVPETLIFYVHTNKFSDFIDVNFTMWFSRCKHIFKTSQCNTYNLPEKQTHGRQRLPWVKLSIYT